MPEPLLQSAEVREGLLHLSWLTPVFDTRATLVWIARSSEGEDRQVFVLPVVGEATLPVGTGNWYVRIGAVQGPDHGIVEWSGIYGPIYVKSPLVTPKSTYTLPVLHGKPVDRGYRIHTGKAEPHIVFFEVGLVTDVGSRFPTGLTKWKWTAEKGYMGWTDCWGLNYPETYAIRMSSFEGPGFPTEGFALLGPGRVFPRVVCSRTPFHKDFAEKQNARGDAILLQQRKVDPNMKFSSHSEYLRFQAAMVRSGDDKARTVGPAHFSAAEEGTL
jgi:hypothetical protein